MRPVDKPSDLVTLIMATGGKEVRITARPYSTTEVE